MLTGSELEALIDWWQANAATTRDDPELVANQDLVLHALAQGTFWANGRLPLSFQPSLYRVQVNESSLFAGSALECLQLPALLGDTVTVESTCPSSGMAIRLVITCQGITSCEPPGCVLSMIMPGKTLASMDDDTDDPINPIRRLAHFFSSAEAASLWSVAYPDFVILDIDQAWRLVNSAPVGQDRLAPTGRKSKRQCAQ